MKVAIVGFGLEGRSSLAYWLAKGDEITVCDQDSTLKLPSGVKPRLGEDYLEDLDQFDLIVRSAGIAPDKLLVNSPGVKDRITSQLNEFLKVCPSKQLIGVTGTKGKGTTTSLIAKALEASGKTVVIGGNIGVAMLSLLDQIDKASYVVLELSSFQLTDLNEVSPAICVCLMVTPEHLDWHDDINSYTEAKTRLFKHQSRDSVAIYFSGNDLSKQIASASPGKLIPYFSLPGAYVDGEDIKIDNQVICRTKDLKLIGKHNWQNVCAAITTVWQISQDTKALHQVVTSFSGLEHRLELVKELDGVKYIDDSYGTTPETAVVAMEAFLGPKVLIAGGSDKGLDYSPMIEAILRSNVKAVLCVGQTGPKIADLINQSQTDQQIEVKVWPEANPPSMEDIVKTARQKAIGGDVVLLSTGSASFGMFKNYKDRGEQFNRAVNLLN